MKVAILLGGPAHGTEIDPRYREYVVPLPAMHPPDEIWGSHDDIPLSINIQRVTYRLAIETPSIRVLTPEGTRPLREDSIPTPGCPYPLCQAILEGDTPAAAPLVQVVRASRKPAGWWSRRGFLDLGFNVVGSA